MVQRDMIFVERVTDGERCGSNCGQKDWRGYNIKNEGVNICVAFGHERLWGDNSKPKRCPSCLSTPSVAVLTAEMLDAVNEAAEMFEDQEWPNYANKLRAAFTQIKAMGK